MIRVLAWIVECLIGLKHHKPGHKPQPGPTLAACVDDCVRVSDGGGMAQMETGPETVRVSASVSARITGSPPPIISLAAVVGERVRIAAAGVARLGETEIVRISDVGAAQLSSPELVRVTDLASALLTGHTPVPPGVIVCDFCSDEVRVRDVVTARLSAMPALALDVAVTERVRAAAGGTAQLVRVPEVTRISDVGRAQLTAPELVRLVDYVTARRTP